MTETAPEVVRDDNPQFEVKYSAPYVGLLDPNKNGRWFVMPDEDDPNGALVWTDGTSVGWMSINDNLAFTKQFNKFRYAYRDQGLSAEEAFDRTFEFAEDSSFGVDIETGLLASAMDQFKSLYNEKTGTTNVEQESYGVTLDEGGNVLDLIRSDETGTFYRENGQWIAIDTDDESASDIIDGPEWVDASANIVPFFDANSDSDHITREEILPFIQE